MRAENAGGLIFLEFAGGPRELLICCGEEVESADGGVDRRGAEKAASILQRVDNSGMATAGEQHETAGSIENEGLVVRNVVFHPTVSGVDFCARGIVFFRVYARNWTGEPDAGKKLFGFVVHDEDAAAGLEFLFHRNHRIGIVASPFEENASCD